MLHLQKISNTNGKYDFLININSNQIQNPLQQHETLESSKNWE